MEKWLTTGQMIDALKPGHKAEGHIKEADSVGFNVFADKIGHIRSVKSGDLLEMLAGFRDMKWRILPNYVSFEEAMKALEEGKEVCAIFSNGSEVYIDEADSLHSTVTEMGCISWGVLLNLKWTIGE